MIERVVIHGREVTVQYLTKDRQPTDKVNAVVIRLRYPDGTTATLVEKAPSKE